MKDNQGLEVSTDDVRTITIINQATEILFRKKSGIEKLLPMRAYPDCAILQIYTAIMFFFSFSKKIIDTNMSDCILNINITALNEREQWHFEALKILKKIDFYTALHQYKKILGKYPQDKIAILMFETCGFLSGEIESLDATYQDLYPIHQDDPDFLGTIAFFYCHTNRFKEAKELIKKGLSKDPHNAWLHHVYAHTLKEDSMFEVEEGIVFLKQCSTDWSKQNRFFEGHNWMHLYLLYLIKKENLEALLEIYPKHIWGKAKKFNFEQNNAFLILWYAELAGYTEIPPGWWIELAQYAEPFMVDYFTPYLTTTAILTVARIFPKKADSALRNLEIYVSSLDKNSSKYHAWYNITLPILKGCLAYLKDNKREAYQCLKKIIDKTRAMGHSDEQRHIFSLICAKAKEAV